MTFAERMHGALRFLATLVSEVKGMKVSISGDTGYSDPVHGVINLPRLPNEDDHALHTARGVVFHEGAHFCFSEYAVYERNLGNPLMKTLINVFDDIHIERRMTLKFAGAASALANMISVMKGWYFQAATEEDAPTDVLVRYTIYRLRETVLGQDTADITAATREVLLAQYGADFEQRYWALISEGIKAVNSTAEAEALAKEVVAFLAQEKQPPQQGQGQGQGQDQDQGQDQGQGQGQDQSQDQGQGKSQGQGQDQNASGNPSSTAGNTTGSGGTGAGSWLDRLEAEAAQGVVDPRRWDIGQAALDQLNAKANEQPANRYLPEVPAAKPVKEYGRVDLGHVLVSSRALRGAMVSFLEAEERLPARTAVFGGRYAMDKIWRYRLGDDALRVRKAETIAVNTAIWLLLDTSGSMNGRPLEVATESLLAATLAMEAIPGTKVGVAVFPYTVRGSAVGVVLNPGEPIRKHANRFDLEAHGGTPLAEALTWTGAHILAMKEPRKMVFVLTDGHPNDMEGVVTVVDGLTRAGVETFGIGIGNDAPVKAMFPEHANVEQLADLRGALFGMLKSQLRARR